MSGDLEGVVVGGGMAGLCAARRLVDAGFRVSLFEARRKIGGEARPGWLTGAGDRALIEFLTKSGLREEALAAARAFSLGPAGTLAPAATEGALPPGLWGTRLRLPRLARVLRGMRGSLRPDAPELAARYDDRCIGEFADLYLGPRAAHDWIEPWLASRAPLDAGTTSRVAALWPLAERRDGPLYALRGAPETRDPRWTRGVTVHCGAAVDRIEIDGGLLVRTGGEAFRARVVVLALPIAKTLGVVGELLSRAQRRALGAIRGGPATSWAGSISEVGGLLDAATGAFASIRVPRERSDQVAAICVDRERRQLRAPLRAGTTAAVDDLARHLEELLPGLFLESAGGRLDTRERPRFGVGRYADLAVARRLTRGLPGIFLAGEAWNEATLEGAAQSGRRAAAAAIRYLARAPGAATHCAATAPLSP